MMKMFDLTGKGAVVIGGAGGLGLAIVKGLAEAGAKVAIADMRDEDSLKNSAKEVKDEVGKTVSYYKVDATNEASVEALVAATAKELGKIDILVNAQGINKKFAAEEFPLDAFKLMFDVNVGSVMLTCKHFGKHMMANKYGKIVNISSVRGKIATRGAGNVGYCGTKGALDMITRQFASEYGPHNITVNAIGPTVTETPMMTEILNQRGPEARKGYAEGNPLKRMALPSDVVGPAIFLASEASCFVTGNILYPDGGLTCVG